MWLFEKMETKLKELLNELWFYFDEMEVLTEQEQYHYDRISKILNKEDKNKQVKRLDE